MSKSTRSSKIKEEPESSSKQKIYCSIPTALHKVFYIAEHMVADDAEKLKLERFYHPGKGKPTLFMTKQDKHMMEILEFAEARRSWLIDSEVSSNGHIYITTPIDVTFLALHHLRKHCQKRALALDSICDDNDLSVAKIFTNYVDPIMLKCIADVKMAGEDMSFYKYNHEKAIAWLSLKTKRVAKALQSNSIYCGNSAISQNFTKSEKAVDETTKDTDYLRMACDYVGSYIDLDLHDELTKYLKIPSEIQAITDEKKISSKRKSSDNAIAVAKKQKLTNDSGKKLKNSDKSTEFEYDEEMENKVNSSSNEEPTAKSPLTRVVAPLKERSLSAKEKALVKSAKGTKSIASFFTKKSA